MPRKRNQAAERQGAVYQDQHGRAWETTYDTQAMGTCQAPVPWRWDAPVLPPPAYFQEFRNKALYFEINYAKWIDDLDTRAREHRQQAVELARKMDKTDTNDPMVREILGRPPFPSDFAKACRAGNKWALGFVKDWRTRYPSWAEPIKEFWYIEPPKVQQFEDVDYSEPDALPDERYGQYEDVADPRGIGAQRQKTVKMKPTEKAVAE